MPITKVSNKYQVVIPKAIRDRVKIKEGQDLQVYSIGDAIILAPKSDLKWPDDYLGTEKDFWSKIDVRQHIEHERNSWD